MNAFDLAFLMGTQHVEVWPENHRAFTLFCRVGTQWRTGMAGATGLDYNVVLSLIDRLDLGEDEADELFDDVRHLESVALEVMRESQ